MGFGISGGITKIDNQKKLLTLSNPGKPNARYDYYQNGNLKSSRFTDPSGVPTKSIHFTNPRMHPQLPHTHDWGWVNGQWTEFSEWY